MVSHLAFGSANPNLYNLLRSRPITYRRCSQVPQVHAAGLAPNTQAPLKDGSSPSGTRYLHRRTTRKDHTRKSSYSPLTSMDPCSSTSCCQTICLSWYALFQSGFACVPDVSGVPGFIVLGLDYFFEVPIQDLPADRDKAGPANEALATANEAFPKRLDTVKATYDERLCPRRNPPPPSESLTFVVCASKRQSTPWLIRIP